MKSKSKEKAPNREKTPISASLYGHIVNDAELLGTVKVQGNSFGETFNYLNDYINELVDENKSNHVSPDLINQIQLFINDVQALVQHEERITSLMYEDNNHLKAFISEISNSILGLEQNKSFLLPGGWNNLGKPGHAMIYQFIRKEDGLYFSIYNAGAGIGYHEKQSTPHSEQFFPVKTFKIPISSKTGLNESEMKGLLLSLITAQLPLHDSRHNKTREMSASKLYEKIEYNLAFLNASPLLASETIPHDRTTAGQISGTCSQRSIHQMLKINFDTLPHYQRFIFDFKMHALREYILSTTYNDSRKVAQDILLGIQNNLKIAQQPGLFENEQEKQEACLELINLSNQMTSKLSKLRHHYSKKQRANLIEYHVPLLHGTSSKDRAISIKARAPLSNAPIQTIKDENQLEQIQHLIESCRLYDLNHDNQRVTQEIEHAIHMLFIQGLHCPTELSIRFRESLSELYALYKKNNKANDAKRFVTKCTFLDLYSQLYDTNDTISLFLTKTLEGTVHSPNMATHDAQYDSQYTALLKRYTRLKFEPTPPLSTYKYFLQENDKKILREYYNKSEKDASIDASYLDEHLLLELYYLFTQLDSNGRLKLDSPLTNEAALNGLLNKIEEFFHLEEFMHDIETDAIQKPLSIKTEKVGYRTLEKLLSPTSNVSSLLLPTPQYKGSSEPVNQAIKLTHPIAENEVQTTNTDFSTRELLAFRSNPSFQINLTLDHFNHAIDELLDVDKRLYLEANLFEPGLLIEALQKDPAFFLRMNTFLEKGLHHFMDSAGCYSEESLYFIRLSIYFNRYVSEYAQPLAAEANQYLHKNMTQINCQVNMTTQPEILVSLHQYRFITAVTLHQLQASEDDEALLAEAFASFFTWKSAISLQSNISFSQALNRTVRPFNDWLQSLPEEQLKKLTSSLLQLDDPSISGSYPLFVCDHLDDQYFIDLEQGQLFKNGRLFSNIPSKIKDKSIMRMLDLEQENTCFISNQGSTYEFKSPISARIDIEDKRLYAEKKWMIDGYEDWYQLIPLDKNRETNISSKRNISLLYLNASSSENPIRDSVLKNNYDVPLYVMYLETLYYVHDDYHIQKIKTNADERTKITEACPKSENANIFSLSEEQLNIPTFKAHQASLIQLPKSIQNADCAAWVKKDGSSGFITHQHQRIYEIYNSGNATRQELKLINQDGETTPYSLVSHSSYHDKLMAFEDPDYFRVHLNNNNQGGVELDRYGLTLSLSPEEITIPGTNFRLQPENSPFQAKIAHLQFNDGSNQKCIVPVQQFYCDPGLPQTIAESYQLTHDVSRYIYEKQNPNDLSLPRWGTEHAITYPIIDGKPKPSCAADALYLCYLYLASNEHEKAWAILDDIKHHLCLEGNADELKYLSWICDSLPVMLPGSDPQSTLNYSPNVACRLKALALYTDFLATGNSSRDSSARSFNKTLPSLIYQEYSALLNRRDHLDIQFQLDEQESHSLLNYYQQFHCATGTLGYEATCLSLRGLIQELSELDALIATNPEKTPLHFKTRRKIIKQELDNQCRWMQKITQLEEAPINLDFPKEKMEIHRQERYLWSIYLEPQNKSSNKTKALNNLSSHITEKQFLDEFDSYFQIACTGSQEEKDKLHSFCVSSLIGNRFTPLNEQDSNIPYLSYMLYCVIHNPNYFVDLKKPKGDTPSESSFNLLWKILEEKKEELTLPPITILQSKDVFKENYEDIVALKKELTENLSSVLHISPATLLQTNKSLSLHERIISQLPLESRARFQATKEGYLDAERKSQPKLNESNEYTAQEEREAGHLKRTCINEQRHLATELFSGQHAQQNLYDLTHTLEAYEQGMIQPDWDAVLNEANRVLHQTKTIQLTAGQCHLNTKQDLYQYYLKADYALYREGCSFNSNEECEHLHQMIHQCVTQAVNKQHVKRLHQALSKINTSELDPLKAANILHVLMSENLLKAQDDPTLQLFQYLSGEPIEGSEETTGILLRPRQIEALQHLLSTPNDPLTFNESIEKIIMGGGKSKIILPILAQKKATGLNLVIIEVPRALLATNHIDLNSTSQDLFGQRAYRFEFDRESDCSPKRLKQIHQQFIDIMNHKAYLVTTGESMQSLGNKYLELLLAKPHDEDKVNLTIWNEQINWLSQIMGILKEQGDTIVDEAHQGFLLKRKFNYTVGQQTNINHDWVKHTIDLYQFLDALHQPNKTLDSASFIDALLTHQSTPLKDLLNTYHLKQNDIRLYLTNQQEPEWLSDAHQDIKNTLAFYKEQSTLVFQTQNRQYKEHYGPSKDPQKSPEQRVLAIPYRANDKPNESSRFGNPLETLNYTTQSMLLEGVSLPLFKQIIQTWQKEARVQLLDNPLLETLDNTMAGKKATLYLKGTSLNDIPFNPKDEQITPYYQGLKDSPPLLYYALEHHILDGICIEPSILHSDAYNHVDLFRSTQGLSGTPSNYTTFHQRLFYNQTTSLGSDGYILDIIQEKKTPILAYSFTQKQELTDDLNQMYQASKNQHNLRALIDISATLIGKTNLEVAQAISKSICMTLNPPLRYVLYFNDDDLLYAWDNHDQKSIRLATSDPDEINEILHCKPDDRFSYYDQAHTVGTDLKQAPNSHALCLIDEKTTLQNFLQGAMRMRGLEEKQSIDLIVPEHMRDITFESLIQSMTNVEATQIKDDNIYATLGKMHNIIRSKALELIARESSIDKKHRLAKALEDYFIEQQPHELFDLCGQIYSEVKTSELHEQQMDRLIEGWKKHLEPLGIEPHANELRATMTDLIKQSQHHCKETCLSPLHTQHNTEVTVEKEQQKELEQLKQLEIQNATYTERARPTQHIPWTVESFTAFTRDGNMKQDGLDSLNEALSCHHFSPELRFSQNYQSVYQGQQSILNPYTKPVYAILFRYVNQHLTAYLISNEDAADIQPLLSHPDNQQYWISTSQQTRLAGTPPIGIETSCEYQSLLEQCRFFNGQCNELTQQTSPFLWLNQDTTNKLRFLQEKILPYRDPIFYQSSFNVLKSHITQTPTYINLIQEVPFDDLSKQDWHKQYPALLPPEIATLEALATAFTRANETFQTTELNIDQFNDLLLPPAALGLLKEHMIRLDTIKGILKNILSLNPDPLNIHQQELLNQFIHNQKSPIKYQENPLDYLASIIQSPYITNKKPFENQIKELMRQESNDELASIAPQNRALLILNYTSPSTETLRELLKQPLSDELLITMINQDTCNLDILKMILARPNTMSIKLLEAIITHTHDTKLLQQLLNKPNINDPRLLTLIAERASDPTLFNMLLNTPFVETIFIRDAYIALLNNRKLPLDQVSKLLSKPNLPAYIYLKIAQSVSQTTQPIDLKIDETMRHTLEKNIRCSALIKAIFLAAFSKDGQIDDNQLDLLISNHSINPDADRALGQLIYHATDTTTLTTRLMAELQLGNNTYDALAKLNIPELNTKLYVRKTTESHYQSLFKHALALETWRLDEMINDVKTPTSLIALLDRDPSINEKMRTKILNKIRSNDAFFQEIIIPRLNDSHIMDWLYSNVSESKLLIILQSKECHLNEDDFEKIILKTTVSSQQLCHLILKKHPRLLEKILLKGNYTQDIFKTLMGELEKHSERHNKPEDILEEMLLKKYYRPDLVKTLIDELDKHSELLNKPEIRKVIISQRYNTSPKTGESVAHLIADLKLDRVEIKYLFTLFDYNRLVSSNLDEFIKQNINVIIDMIHSEKTKDEDTNLAAIIARANLDCLHSLIEKIQLSKLNNGASQIISALIKRADDLPELIDPLFSINPLPAQIGDLLKQKKTKLKAEQLLTLSNLKGINYDDILDQAKNTENSNSIYLELLHKPGLLCYQLTKILNDKSVTNETTKAIADYIVHFKIDKNTRYYKSLIEQLFLYTQSHPEYTANESYRIFELMPDESKHQLINQTNSQNQTLLHQLLESGSDTEQEMVNIATLLSYGANPNVEDDVGQTPLHLVAKHGRANAVILFKDSSPNVQEATGKTPLHLAAENGHNKVITQLYGLGATIDAQDNQGQTPLHLAAKQDYPKTLELLYLLGATIDALDHAKQTPAYLAAYSDHLPNMLQLNDYGANLEAKNDMGLSPIDIYHTQLKEKVSLQSTTEARLTIKDQLNDLKSSTTEPASSINKKPI